MNILFYAVNGVSLGHINRLVCIARALRRQWPAARLLFVTNSDFVDFFYRYKLHFVKIPKDFDSTLAPEDFDFAVPKPSNLKILEGICSGFNPDLIFFDTICPEEFLIDCKMRGVRAFMILDGYKTDLVETLLPKFDTVFIGSEPDSSCSNTKVNFVGTIIREEQWDSSVRKKYGITKEKLNLLITCGSGGYEPETKSLLSESIKACKQLQQQMNLNIIAVSGPLFRGHKEFIGMDGVKFTRYEPKLISLMQSVDLVISHAGRNTSNELLHYKVPSILLPVYREGDDQKKRVRTLGEAGLCLGIEDWNHEKIRMGILSLVSNNREGLRKISESLIKLKMRNGAVEIGKLIGPASALPKIALEGKNLTAAIAEVKMQEYLGRIFIDKGSFGWQDLQLLLEWLKVAGSTEIFLSVDKPIPGAMLPCLEKYPIVYLFNLDSRQTLEQLLPALRLLKSRHLPLLFRVLAKSPDEAKLTVNELIGLKAYTIQLMGTGSQLLQLANQRLLPENSLFDITLGTEQNFPSKEYLKAKELAEVVNEHKARVKQKEGLLISKNIQLGFGHIQDEILGLFMPNNSMEIENLEAKKQLLLKSKGIIDELQKLDKQIEKLNVRLNAHFNKVLKPLTLEQNRLYYEQHLLFESKGLVEERSKHIALAKELERKRELVWTCQKKLQEKAEQLIKERELRLKGNKTHSKIIALQESLREATQRKNGFWEEYINIEAELNEKRSEFGKKKAKLGQFVLIEKVKAQMSQVDTKFNNLIKTRFESVRIAISLLESKSVLTEAEKSNLEKLKAERDEIWTRELAPLERDKDKLLFEIRKLEANPSYAKKQTEFVQIVSDLDTKRLAKGKQLDEIKIIVERMESELKQIENSVAYIKFKSKLDKPISTTNKEMEKLSSEITTLWTQSKEIESKWVSKLEACGIAGKLKKINDRILDLEKIIEKKRNARDESYMAFLNQKRDALLVSSGAYNELVKIKCKLSDAYASQSEQISRIRELKNKLNALLIQAEVFREFYDIEARIAELEKEMSRIKAY